MIKIIAPIELKTGIFAIRDRGFNERIRDNYAVMGSNISTETLTHAIHTPPEILVAEGSESTTNIGGTSFSFTNVQQTLINNAVNRILVSGDYTLNYQDRVFITSVLNKLGVRDERRFMEEVKSILSESSNTLRLTKLYLENSEEIRNLLEYERANRPPKKERKSKEKETEVYENNLWQNIMNRLQTGMIYQIVENMNISQVNAPVNRVEVSNSEQSYTARQLLLQRYRTVTVGEDVPFIYRADNVFAEDSLEPSETTEEKVKETINSAALLEMIRSYEHVNALRHESDRHYWTDYRNSFYGSADHVLEKILLGVRENRSAFHFDDTALSFVDNTQLKEINALTGIISEKERSEELFSEAFLEYFERYYEEGPETESEYYEETEHDSETYSEQVTEREHDSARMLLFERRENETLSENLERINNNNKENLERYKEIRQILFSEDKKSSIKSDRERTIRESLRSLSDREHLMKLVESIDKTENVTVDRKLEQIYKILPPETVEILKQLEAKEKGQAGDTATLTEAALAEMQINNFVTDESDYVPAEMVYEPEQTEEEASVTVMDEDELTSDLIARVLNETEILDNVSNFVTMITTQLNRETQTIYETERLSRIGNSPAEMEYLESLISESGITRTIVNRFEESPREFKRLSNMIHKITETLTEEDVMERLEEFRRLNTKEKVVVNEQPSNVNTFVNNVPQQAIVNNVTPLGRQEREEIAELVERGVRSQLNMISTEVYTRLEKRLKSEKARRGI